MKYLFKGNLYENCNLYPIDFKVRNICQDKNGEVFAYEGIVEYDQGVYSAIGNDRWVRLVRCYGEFE